MSQQEKDNSSSHEHYDSVALEKIREDSQEVLREKLERSVENRAEKRVEDARHEALEQASPVEKKLDTKLEKGVDTPERHRPTSKREKNASYERTMDEVRSQLSSPSRAFSNFIHNPTVEKVSDAVGGTIARPNAILSGSLFAFLFTLGLYLIASSYGYRLSGTETIASFVFGWALGLVFDYLRLVVVGKNR